MRKRSSKVRLINTADPAVVPFYDVCCWPECDQPSGTGDVPLCQRHHMQAWRTFEKMALWPLREMREDALSRALQHASEPRSRSTEPGYVYFARFGDRIKIGFTTNLKQRMGNIPHDQMIGSVPGTMSDEKRCHAAFEHLRIVGEWFEPGQDLLDFIDEVSQPPTPQVTA